VPGPKGNGHADSWASPPRTRKTKDEMSEAERESASAARRDVIVRLSVGQGRSRAGTAVHVVDDASWRWLLNLLSWLSQLVWSLGRWGPR